MRDDTTPRPQIDVNVPRVNQAAVAVLTAIAFVMQWWQLVPIAAAIVAVTRFAGPRFGPVTQAYLRLVRPRLNGRVETEWAAPPRFSQLLAVAFLLAASLLFVAGVPAAGWAVTLLVTGLATLAAVARICVGCLLYEAVAAKAAP